ncbi:protein phosphatase 2C domain-containing protein [Cognatiyoonia sp. IB215446]|uniref:PP2C family protein-serine/threonine phosphatase n=1 Tax=Cognatiyoonia sp. IB215446 TaxID=3097355 RepID=UPI002A0F96EE|nr:protein phosphatase 2C domain-containing protein [Cognatiyoonia sp. IB215446]MDX8346855.1 protein phosphatase 2C domain-containing protein [Cognatiyoonia sp. IB215446]
MNTHYTFGRQRAKPAPDDSTKRRFDPASFVHVGRRDYQQDALMTNMPRGEPFGIAVLADGMGGHRGGEVAGNVAMGAAFAEISVQLAHFRNGQVTLPAALVASVDRANDAITNQIITRADLAGMGTTLVICAFAGPALYWASVGDSPLYHYRDGALTRLNEDHSMAPQIDAMVQSGMIDAIDAATHPQRNQLVSALCGKDIAKVDCPDAPLALKTGDIILLASDGLQTLTDDQIAQILRKRQRAESEEIASALLQSVLEVGKADQDNTSLIVVKVLNDDPPPRPVQPVALADAQTEPPASDDPQIEQASDLLNKALQL